MRVKAIAHLFAWSLLLLLSSCSAKETGMVNTFFQSDDFTGNFIVTSTFRTDSEPYGAVESNKTPEGLGVDNSVTQNEPFLKGEFSLSHDQFESERAFIDLGTGDKPLVIELGWLSSNKIAPPNTEHDYFVHILSLNGEPIFPVFVEPVDDVSDVLFLDVSHAYAVDLDGDENNELVLYYSRLINGGKGAGYIVVFSFIEGEFKRLQIPSYLNGFEGLSIKWLGENYLSISCNNPVFELVNKLSELPYEYPSHNEFNWIDPPYDFSVTDNGELELYQYLCLNGIHQGIGEFITVISWSDLGVPIISCRFTQYTCESFK